jgi:hypothetical protein
VAKRRGLSQKLIISALGDTPRIPASLYDEKIDHNLQRFDTAHTAARQALERGDPEPYKKFLEALTQVKSSKPETGRWGGVCCARHSLAFG